MLEKTFQSVNENPMSSFEPQRDRNNWNSQEQYYQTIKLLSSERDEKYIPAAREKLTRVLAFGCLA